jgi:alkylation response protein AidB-like acyl-CoA dehydrogenase
VSGPTTMRTQEIPIPEPDLTPEAVIGRARALIPAIRDQQDEAERLGHHTPELDRQFAAAGFYRILQPRRFGGYEFGLPTFWQVMLAAARAVEIIFAAAGSSAAKRGTRLQRYYRDVAMYRGHIAAQDLNTAGDLARVHFGLPDSLF